MELPFCVAERIDWKHWEYVYVTGQMTLGDLSREASGNPDAPSLIALKKKSADDNWAGKRSAYRGRTEEKALEIASCHDAVKEAKVAVDSAAIIQRQLEMAEKLQKTCDLMHGAIAAQLADANFAEAMSITSPKIIAEMLRTLGTVIVTSSTLEKTAITLEQELRAKESDTVASLLSAFDLSKLSPEQLEQLQALLLQAKKEES